MRNLNAAPPCLCCGSLRGYISTHLNPGGALRKEDHPGQVVDELDNVFRDEGGSKVDVSEMAAYLTLQPSRHGTG